MRYTPAFARDFEAWLSATEVSYRSACRCPSCRGARAYGAKIWREHFFPVEIHIHPSGYVQVVVVYGRTGDYLRTASSIFAFEWVGGASVGATPISALKRIELGFVGILPAEEGE